MKKTVLVSVLMLLIVIIALFSVSMLDKFMYIEYNNSARLYDCITQTYTKASIEKLRNLISYSDIQKNYAIQCTRKTHQGYYVIFLQEDQSRVFVFINEEQEINKIMTFNHFKTKEDFNFIVPNQTSFKEIIDWDDNTVLFPISSGPLTAHIIKDGIILIKYTCLSDGVLLPSPIVETIDFINDAESTNESNWLISMNVPYILPIDKE